MKRFTFTGESSAAPAGTWHTLGIPGDTDWVDIKSLTVSTRAQDQVADIGITILDASALQTGIIRWKGVLRNAKEYGKHFPNIGLIRIKNKGLMIHTDRGAAKGGAGVYVVVSCVYNCYTADEEVRNQAGI